MRTFDRIAELIDESERMRRSNELMLEMGAATRTDAGSRFFLSTFKRQNEALFELHQYPYEWIVGVKHALTIINNPNIKSRAIII